MGLGTRQLQEASVARILSFESICLGALVLELFLPAKEKIEKRYF